MHTRLQIAFTPNCGPNLSVYCMLQKTLIFIGFFVGLSTSTQFLSISPIARTSLFEIVAVESRSDLPLPPSLAFFPTSIPNGLYGSAYKSQTLKVTGGRSPYSFSISGGSLPKGMSLSASGVLSGTPTIAGTYSFTVTAEDNTRPPNTVSGSQNYNLVIDPASLTIEANDATMTYGGTIPAFSVTYRGFVNGDNASSLDISPTITTTATSSSAAGNYTITASGAKDPNYSFTYSSGTLTINRATINVTAAAQTKEFGTADPAFTYTVSGFLNGDNTSIFTGSLGRNPGEAVGTYSITKGNLNAGNNYTINYTGNSLTITKASQHITWGQSLLIGCKSSTQLQLTATASSSLPVTYSVSDASIATVSGNVLTLLHPGTTVITATQPGDLNHTAAAPVNDTLFYQPESLISQHWNDAIFFDNSSGNYVQWQWYKNDQLIPGASSPVYSETPSLNGQYYVIATDKSGKQIQSCTLSITAGAAIPGGIKVYPNPANSGAHVTISSNYSSAALQGATLQITDINGKVRQQLTAIQPSMQITLPSETGIYIIKLLLASGQRASVNVLVMD